MKMIDQPSDVMHLEETLTLREALILLSLATGSYNELGIGTSMVGAMLEPQTPEMKLMGLGLIEEIQEESETVLSPTPDGRVAARWFAGVFLDVVAPELGKLLD